MTGQRPSATDAFSSPAINTGQLLDGNGIPMCKWRIRIRSEEPVLIEFTEIHYEPVAPMTELYTLVRRTSYMVEGPNREVWWALDLWMPGKGEYEAIVQGKSRLHSGKAAS